MADHSTEYVKSSCVPALSVTGFSEVKFTWRGHQASAERQGVELTGASVPAHAS